MLVYVAHFKANKTYSMYQNGIVTKKIKLIVLNHSLNIGLLFACFLFARLI